VVESTILNLNITLINYKPKTIKYENN